VFVEFLTGELLEMVREVQGRIATVGAGA
jgi:hypothetical protein